ncbi:MAG TPA: hypothetical protein DIT07_14520 [Sphingobacteriaceae bacterium]|nr:hypothetical protein [Sphingobacteriaceae bacterium]
MKKVSFIAAILMVCVSALFASNLQTKPAPNMAKPAATKTQKVTVQYTCTMHPEVITDKPGKCPKCGMTLVKKVDKKATTGKKMQPKSV